MPHGLITQGQLLERIQPLGAPEREGTAPLDQSPWHLDSNMISLEIGPRFQPPREPLLKPSPVSTLS